MKNIFFTIFLALSINSFAQKWVSPNYSNQYLDYRDLGYPGVNEIPADDSRISALLTNNGKYVYGATSGKQAYLFLFDKYINKVRPLGKLPNTSGIHHTMVSDDEGNIYIGTGMNLLDEIPLTRDFSGGHRAIETQLWKDVLNYHADFEGGRILKYSTKNDEKVFLTDDNAIVEDLGLVQGKNSIYALTINNNKDALYGITYPEAHFFKFDIKLKQTIDYGEMLDTLVYSGPERSWRSVPRALVCLENGKILTAGDDGLIVLFNPETEKFEKTDMRIPGEYWESWNYIGYPVVEQLVVGGNNTIFGSTSDGFIFKIDLRSNTLIDLGKPRLARRVRGMALAKDSTLYMLCGELGQPCKLYSYNTNGLEGFENWSYISVDRSPYYAKRAYQFDAMSISDDGTLFMGESDRRGKLFLFMPGGDIFKGGLNPKTLGSIN
ncbi:MAG: PQQ-like beta-propeller repeat protein [Chloroflexia bacterium]|nr:PQQ-like beta-propeller repeat protein [Chloroflexia bacterium]